MIPNMGGFGDGGHYDNNGQWVRTKFCFVYCGPERCNCMPPGGVDHLPMDSHAVQVVVEKKSE